MVIDKYRKLFCHTEEGGICIYYSQTGNKHKINLDERQVELTEASYKQKGYK
jgi:hypothetical protein